MIANPFSFKTLFWAYTCCVIPFALLGGILSLFNISAVSFNNAHVYGIKGFIITIVYIPIAGLILAVTNWLALNFGRLIYNSFSKFKSAH